MGTHLHITSWVVAFILLIAVVILHNKQNKRVANILHMILRLFYIIILVSGIQLLMHYFKYNDLLLLALVKSFVGLWLIASMEMLSVRKAKGKSTGSSWAQIAIGFVIALVLGFGFLPL